MVAQRLSRFLPIVLVNAALACTDQTGEQPGAVQDGVDSTAVVESPTCDLPAHLAPPVRIQVRADSIAVGKQPVIVCMDSVLSWEADTSEIAAWTVTFLGNRSPFPGMNSVSSGPDGRGGAPARRPGAYSYEVRATLAGEGGAQVQLDPDAVVVPGLPTGGRDSTAVSPSG